MSDPISSIRPLDVEVAETRAPTAPRQSACQIKVCVVFNCPRTRVGGVWSGGVAVGLPT